MDAMLLCDLRLDCSGATMLRRVLVELCDNELFGKARINLFDGCAAAFESEHAAAAFNCSLTALGESGASHAMRHIQRKHSLTSS